jgi:hypothetical protein
LKEGEKKRGGDFDTMCSELMPRVLTREYFECRIQVIFSRFGGGMQGWLGYNLNEKDQIQLGLTQVPFGIQQYNSHNWFSIWLIM